MTADVLLARGAVQDRPFGKTVGMIARRGVTGQLTAEFEGATYAMAFERGHIVTASSPALADSAAAIALAHELITPEETQVVERWLETVPDADEIHVVATVALMSGEEAHRLRRRVIAHRAARVIALEHGDFVLTSTIAMPVVPDCEMHIGGVIYQAARLYIHDLRLRTIIESLGTRFELRNDAFEELPYYGFGDAERPFLRALAGGMSLDMVRNIVGEPERRLAQAAIYALASCGNLYCESVSQNARYARGTRTPPYVEAQPAPNTRLHPEPRLQREPDQDAATPDIPTQREVPVLSTVPLTDSTAEEAFHRAQLALRGDRVHDAIIDLELATQLAPNEPRYFAALAWARFCRAPDKTRVAQETRQMLHRAIARSEIPVLPHYYMGMVERIMNRKELALEHFREVLDLQPNHQEAATEVRFLMRKS